MPRQFKFFFIFLLMLSSALIGVTVFAEDYGLGATAQEAGLAKYESNLPKLVGQVVGAALSLTGVLFFGLMIYSGIIWMIDRGNDERAEQAKNTITAAIIGLVIVLAAYAITKFAFEAVPQTGGGGSGSIASGQLCGGASGVCSGIAVGGGCALPTDAGAAQGVCQGPLPVCTCQQSGGDFGPPAPGAVEEVGCCVFSIKGMQGSGAKEMPAGVDPQNGCQSGWCALDPENFSQCTGSKVPAGQCQETDFVGCCGYNIAAGGAFLKEAITSGNPIERRDKCSRLCTTENGRTNCQFLGYSAPSLCR